MGYEIPVRISDRCMMKRKPLPGKNRIANSKHDTNLMQVKY